MNRILILICAVIVSLLPHSLYAQQKVSPTSSLGWDLTYSSVLERNSIGADAWLRGWLKDNPGPSISNLIAEWQGEPIISSVLIENPAFHAGERLTLWFVRTKTRAFTYEFIDGKTHRTKELLKPQLYDKLCRTMLLWKQLPPMSPEAVPAGGMPGYIGFLSLSQRGKSRQLLLSFEDFFLIDKNNPDDDRLVKAGRLSRVLDSILGNQRRNHSDILFIKGRN